MKKLILGAFLIFGVLGFSRYVEECEVTDVSYGYARCRSLETGKTFTRFCLHSLFFWKWLQ